MITTEFEHKETNRIKHRFERSFTKGDSFKTSKEHHLFAVSSLVAIRDLRTDRSGPRYPIF